MKNLKIMCAQRAEIYNVAAKAASRVIREKL
jgi:hypothetical protein